ncbi:DLW-39 family protein [Haematomicrobium sanguinis]|nr:DLW-39 family protein [Haematomicrobium sanguinis]
MKKLLLVAAVVAGVMGYKKWKESEADKSVWDNATDKVK